MIRLTATERKALRNYSRSSVTRCHAHTMHSLERKGLIESGKPGRRLTALGQQELGRAIPRKRRKSQDVFAELFRPQTNDYELLCAAKRVLEEIDEGVLDNSIEENGWLEYLSDTVRPLVRRLRRRLRRG